MYSDEELEEFSLAAPLEEPPQDNPFVQIEEELMEAHLQRIAAELVKLTMLYNSLRDELTCSTLR